jgi:hypothetical protein
MPLAFIFTIVLNIDLQGQTAAVVIGYMVSGMVNSYLLFTSDWEKLSQEVIEANRDAEAFSSSSSSSSDDESSSSSEPPASLLMLGGEHAISDSEELHKNASLPDMGVPINPVAVY